MDVGFSIIATSGPAPFGWAMLKLNDTLLMLNTAYEDDHRPPRADPARVAAHGDTILYFGCDSADEVYENLRLAGLEPAPPTTSHYGMRQVGLRDPDGYELCFQHPAR